MDDSFKKHARERSRQRFVRYVRRVVEQAGSTGRIFRTFRHPPSKEGFVEMALAGRFGGKEPLGQGGPEFALEYAFDELNRAVDYFMKQGGGRLPPMIPKWRGGSVPRMKIGRI